MSMIYLLLSYVICVIFTYEIIFEWQQKEYQYIAQKSYNAKKYYKWDIILSIAIGLIIVIILCKEGLYTV